MRRYQVLPLGGLGTALAVLGILVGALCAASAEAHDQYSARVAAVDAEIAEHPTDPRLYLKRGRSHAADRHWSLALADYEVAADLGAKDEVDLARGRLFLAAGWPAAANVYLSRLADNADLRDHALHLRGQARYRMERYAEAAHDYEAALASGTSNTPEFTIEMARALTRAGRIDDALGGLDESLERFGPLSSIAGEAVEIAVSAERYDDALARLDILATNGARPDFWRTRRAEVLELAGRPEEARETFLAVRAALAQPDVGQRGQRAREAIGTRIDSGLERLELADNGVGTVPSPQD